MFDLSKSVGYQIQKYRKEKGLTQQDLAKEIEANQRSLSDWERGRSEVSLKNLQKISEVLKVPISALLCNENKEKNIEQDVNELKNRISVLEKIILNKFSDEKINVKSSKNAVGKVNGNIGILG